MQGGRTVRTFLVDGPNAEAICRRARELRMQAGTLSGAALGEMPGQDTADTAAVLDGLGQLEVTRRGSGSWPAGGARGPG
jgi:hypothetical protein